jgi:hypothetical protein
MDGSGTHEGPGQFHDQDSQIVDRLLFILTAVLNSGSAGLVFLGGGILGGAISPTRRLTI